MGKRTSIESEQQATGKEIRLPADSTIKTFNSEFCEVQETVDEANDRLKDAADIAKKKHLNVWAFKVCQKLFDDVKNAKNEALASEKLAVKLAQFDKMRKYFKLDELAGLQGRMFAEGEIGSTPKGDDEDEIEASEDDKDLRPRHLRQPGASVTSAEPDAAAKAVQDLAARTGASLRTDEADVAKVGRGKTDTTKH